MTNSMTINQSDMALLKRLCEPSKCQIDRGMEPCFLFQTTNKNLLKIISAVLMKYIPQGKIEFLRKNNQIIGRMNDPFLNPQIEQIQDAMIYSSQKQKIMKFLTLTYTEHEDKTPQGLIYWFVPQNPSPLMDEERNYAAKSLHCILNTFKYSDLIIQCEGCIGVHDNHPRILKITSDFLNTMQQQKEKMLSNTNILPDSVLNNRCKSL